MNQEVLIGQKVCQVKLSVLLSYEKKVLELKNQFGYVKGFLILIADVLKKNTEELEKLDISNNQYIDYVSLLKKLTITQEPINLDHIDLPIIMIRNYGNKDISYKGKKYIIFENEKNAVNYMFDELLKILTKSRKSPDNIEYNQTQINKINEDIELILKKKNEFNNNFCVAGSGDCFTKRTKKLAYKFKTLKEGIKERISPEFRHKASHLFGNLVQKIKRIGRGKRTRKQNYSYPLINFSHVKITNSNLENLTYSQKRNLLGQKTLKAPSNTRFSLIKPTSRNSLNLTNVENGYLKIGNTTSEEMLPPSPASSGYGTEDTPNTRPETPNSVMGNANVSLTKPPISRRGRSTPKRSTRYHIQHILHETNV